MYKSMKGSMVEAAAVVLACIFALACGHGTAGSAPPDPNSVSEAVKEIQKDRFLKIGAWGGDHISAQVDEKGVVFELDCADARIDGPVKLDRKGAFSVEGTVSTQQPGPVREDRPNKPQRARFSGKVTGETMSLSITLIDTKDEIGSYKLSFGRTGRVFRCY